MSYSGILDFIKGDKHEKVDAGNIPRCPVCDKPLFSIKTQAWGDMKFAKYDGSLMESFGFCMAGIFVLIPWIIGLGVLLGMIK